ncbi:beta-1,4-galactosyltransferase 4-like [Leguminivora glycinivorella]|uniref:beta-1,4-galactosyltransferase 4-like n=1 Tax=Leguminivora glycinivorella TaxID=1035111 RepID=UPI00200F1DAE|nr:beta-1,4-galactosyltransferase 4-like [Leguminivora glycinivorella]
MGTLNYSLGSFFPVRKVSPSLLLLRPQRRYTQLPSNLHECIDRPSPTVVYRPFVVLILLLPLVFYFYRINGMEINQIKATRRGFLLNNTYVVKRTKSLRDTTMEIFDKGVRGARLNKTMPAGNKTAESIDSSEVFDDATEDTPTENTKIANITEILPHSGLPVCEIQTSNNTKVRNLTINYNVTKEPAFLQNPLIEMGGYYKPSKCLTRHRIAIIVPYRQREKNLAIFLTHMHQFLMNQQIEYRIYVIEQSGTEKFNKGRVLNAGFDQIKDYWECFIFHDVDLLPLDPGILYTCPKYPRHMSTTVYEDNEIVKFTDFFGGVTAMKDDHFLLVNGYSNRYWGWGGEDNDMYWRIRLAKLPIMRYNKNIARYLMLPHYLAERNEHRYDILNKYGMSRARHIENGLSSLKYTVVFKKSYPLFSHIVVDVNPYKDPVD